jgi:hypothetical protein
MKNKGILLPVLLLALSACKMNHPGDPAGRNVPSLEEVSGIWVSADTADMEPSIRNFRGTALLNRDMASLSWFVSAPYSGGYHTGILKIGDETPHVSMFRWQPYQAIRKGKQGPFEITTTNRMLPDRDGILWEIGILNTGSGAEELKLSVDLIGFISKYGGDWQWWYPYPKMDGMTTVRDDEVENVRRHLGSRENFSNDTVTDLIDGKPTPTNKTAHWPSDKEILDCKKYRASLEDGNLFVFDSETDAITVFSLPDSPDTLLLRNSGGRAFWSRSLEPGQSLRIRYLMAYGDDKGVLEERAGDWSASFETLSMDAREVWKNRWKEIFTPGNSLISGCFPVLETGDSLARRVYYTGPLTMLYMMNTNLPQHRMVFLTGGPKWGGSITFFWDITEWSSLWAVVYPEMMREHLSDWINIDPSKHYGKDNFGGKGVGNGYSANYWALFQMLRSYLTTTRDFGFLDEQIAGKTVFRHMEDYALNWKNLSPYEKDRNLDEEYDLADFGDDEWNLLECVPTYKHIVPSFNAGYAWMMRELADLCEMRGDTARAGELRKEAEGMVHRILELYAGDGVWYSLYPGNRRIEVRHCLDFMFMGRYLPADIPEDIKQEMIAFLYRELMTDHWMRAQSLQDVAAANSDRPDHGPLGAFDGWPAGTMDALTRMGHPGKALDFYHAIEPVTHEGIWSQAHELWGEHKYDKHARVRIAQRGWHARDASGGISISQVMLKDFFGFYPDFAGNPLQATHPLDFSGSLHHVLYGGEYYRLDCRKGEVTMVREE